MLPGWRARPPSRIVGRITTIGRPLNDLRARIADRLDLRALGYEGAEYIPGERAVHVILRRRA